MPVFRPADRVSVFGFAATVVHGNEPDGWTNGQPSATVNIRFDQPARGMSPQIDIWATSVLPAR